jgi:hypothetical protein
MLDQAREHSADFVGLVLQGLELCFGQASSPARAPEAGAGFSC